jgi:hypothetical protein
MAIAATPASAKTYECHSGGPPAYAADALHVSKTTACTLVGHLLAWNARYYRCIGQDRQTGRPGKPALVLHSFRGWRLSLSGPPASIEGLRLARGASSFTVQVTDGPVNCT